MKKGSAVRKQAVRLLGFRFPAASVIPAKAGIQFPVYRMKMDVGLNNSGMTVLAKVSLEK